MSKVLPYDYTCICKEEMYESELHEHVINCDLLNNNLNCKELVFNDMKVLLDGSDNDNLKKLIEKISII